MKTEESIFADAINLPVSERAGFVGKACDGNEQLRQRMLRLLNGHDETQGILDMPNLPPSDPPPQLLVGKLIDHYQLVEKLGEGGFGVVFKAKQQQPIKRTVALKIIKPGMDSSTVIARFEAERQALALMSHPNIASVLDAGTTENDRPYFVMELVEGISIVQFCDSHRLSINQRLRLFVSVCDAVHHAHQKGIIHRDIKPGNILVSLHNGEPVAKVIDFGIAKALNQRLTAKTLDTLSGAMVGTPQYMSPEQADSRELDVDTRSDVYSLSMLLYELLAGTTTIESKQIETASYFEIQRMVCEDEPVRPSQYLAGSCSLASLARDRSTSKEQLIRKVRGELDWIALKGLQKDRERRYQSASELASDIGRFLKQEPVLAGPPSISYQLQKFAIRNRNQLLLVATALVIIGVITAGLVNHQLHLAAARKETTERLGRAIDDASVALTEAVEDVTSKELWTSVRLKVDTVEELMDQAFPSASVESRALDFLSRYELARDDRDFSISMEELLIEKSTDQSIQNLVDMKRGLASILSQRGYDLNQLGPEELAIKLRKDRTPVKLTDAIELWLATRITLSDAGGSSISKNEVGQWVQSMCTADPNPMRTAIRKTIFKTESSSKSKLDQVASDANLKTACARKLSWLAEAYVLVGAIDEAKRIREFALAKHSDDLMLNFEYATELLEAGKSDQAVRYYMRCTAIRPEIAGVWRNLAVALRQNREAVAARQAMEKAIELAPSHDRSKALLVKWNSEDEDL